PCVIVEATFKVLPAPVASSGLLARFARSADAFAAANAVARGPSRVEACVVEWSEGPTWRLALQARGSGPTVERAVADARREIAARQGSTHELGNSLAAMRELPARAMDGALVRVSLPIAAAAALEDAGASPGTWHSHHRAGAAPLPERGRPLAGADRRMRALRLLPADVPDLRGPRRGDGLAAGSHPPHEDRLGTPPRRGRGRSR